MLVFDRRRLLVTVRMLHLLCVSVFSLGAVLSAAASQSQGVTIHCEKPAEAQVKDNLTLSCTIKYQVDLPSTTDINDCTVAKYYWNKDTNTTEICDETNGGKTRQYTCGLDNMTHLYLHISSVVKTMEGIYRLHIWTDCGFSDTIANVSVTIHEKTTTEEPNGPSVQPALFGLIASLLAITVLVISVYLFTTQKGKRIISYLWSKMRQRSINNISTDPTTEATFTPVMDTGV